MKNQTRKGKPVPPRGKSANGPAADEARFMDMGILDHIERIVELSGEHDIDECLVKGKAHLDHIALKLGISPLQAALFSHFMEKGTDNCIEMGQIAEAIKCSKLRMIKYTNDCEELERKKLIRCRRYNDGVSFRVPRDVTESIRKHDEFRPEKNENLSAEDFFTALERIFDERESSELTCEAMEEELFDLVDQNMHLRFCKKIRGYKLHEEALVLLLRFCHLCASNADDDIRGHDLELLYDRKNCLKRTNRSLSDGSHVLMREKIVEHTNSNGFVNAESWKVSDGAKKELLSELDLKGGRYNEKNLVRHDSIKPKRMFYNPRETAEIQKLSSLLREENYRKIIDRLDGRGMRKGFACLFSGGPGTGKTETAYQIARETGRNIMMVDISEVKSMWYGESEKKIKEIFDVYRDAVDGSELAPILLFNEADAVIGKRKEFGSGGNRSVEQTENTIQNIILQEMENLSGILIATTNLVQNMDAAFERRFLYKIVFDKPGAESRTGIWRALLPDLTEDMARGLSCGFELSGGQIENIARKCEVDEIVNGGGLSMDALVRHCGDELQSGFGSSTKRIGF